MRITKAQLEAAIRGLNAMCHRLNLPAGFTTDHANGGYKLEQDDGRWSVWNDRTGASEYYSRVWCFREGVEHGAKNGVTREEWELIESIAAQVSSQYREAGGDDPRNLETAAGRLDRARIEQIRQLREKATRMLVTDTNPTNGA